MSFPKITLTKKPVYKKLTQDIDFPSLFQKVEQANQTCYLIESLGEEERERHSVIGFDPEMVFTGTGNSLEIIFRDGSQTTLNSINPYQELAKNIPQDILSRNYAGGLFGYLSYEAINYFEPIMNLPEHQDFKQFKFGLYTDGIVYDKLTGELFYFFYNQDRSEQVLNWINSPQPISEPTTIIHKGHSLDKKTHKKIVLETIEEIKNGNSFQCEVGFKSFYQIQGSKFNIYKKLRETNPSPYMFYLKFDNQVILGASPELLLKVKDSEVATFPLAGTIKRGQNPEEDRILARHLLNDSKEIAEHNMLVDMHRNDIGRVSEFGTVKVKRLMDILKLEYVQHIESEITGILKQGEDMFSALAANFPMGTLSGAPKIESMKIIERNEQNPRGPYGGGVGHFGFNGNATICATLRALYINGDEAYSQTSSGIVFDSTPEHEYEEILVKLAGMDKTLADFTE